jgi:hypothetical protein
MFQISPLVPFEGYKWALSKLWKEEKNSMKNISKYSMKIPFIKRMKKFGAFDNPNGTTMNHNDHTLF